MNNSANKKKIVVLAAMVMLWLAVPERAPAQITIQPPFNADYTLVDLGSITVLPSSWRSDIPGRQFGCPPDRGSG